MFVHPILVTIALLLGSISSFAAAPLRLDSIQALACAPTTTSGSANNRFERLASARMQEEINR